MNEKYIDYSEPLKVTRENIVKKLKLCVKVKSLALLVATVGLLFFILANRTHFELTGILTSMWVFEFAMAVVTAIDFYLTTKLSAVLDFLILSVNIAESNDPIEAFEKTSPEFRQGIFIPGLDDPDDFPDMDPEIRKFVDRIMKDPEEDENKK